MSSEELTILYVEDHLPTQELIEEILKAYCKEVFVANNGEEGLLLYTEKKPDMVLSDIRMPIMDGLEMSAAIKAINPEQTIALFTAFNEDEYLEKAANIGIETYMLKPLDRKQFFNSLNFMALDVQMNREKNGGLEDA
ncbi:MAG: Diguanylate cyclase/phosphodiesterase (GGDEF & EAL domains) with PAS/PAC sensor(S) [uncultured Sulfurovum sp.]|uniref:Diguanylate cyclase/phosphodiesterase (GGDEF & EAL domains) with PAS/PAC sensor(S) n=1 Tax=uncultured Sulfurovum sp. TaxID=269237 RepID=A0A6S6SIV6_9BACT|nr:MAG: Diguanylate cyclase/phosphodiesterase (GGDEF & EAL domains) with PAS/PAC sensor(S) [uncultured Sulfurovum sp.]